MLNTYKQVQGAERIALVLGGAGFIGTALMPALKNYSIVCIDNLLYNQYAPRFPFIKMDLTDTQSVKNLVEMFKACNVELIINAAGTVGVHNVYEDPRQCNNNNLRIIMNTMYLMEAWPKARFVFISTSEAYGSSNNCVEDSPLCVLNPDESLRGTYVATKLAGEYTVASNAENYTILRPFNITGAGQPEYHRMVIPTFVHNVMKGKPIQIYGDGTQTRSFCSREQCVYAISRLVDMPEANRQIINVGSPNKNCQLSIADLADFVVEFAHTKGMSAQIVAAVYPYGDYSRNTEIQQRIINVNKLCTLLPEYAKKFESFDMHYIISSIWDYYVENM